MPTLIVGFEVALLPDPPELELHAASASAPESATTATFMTLRKGFSFRCAPGGGATTAEA
jgi:hypothetical protein